MSQARLPRTEPSTELITAHKVNTATLMPPVQTRDFSALPKHRGENIWGPDKPIWDREDGEPPHAVLPFRVGAGRNSWPCYIGLKWIATF